MLKLKRRWLVSGPLFAVAIAVAGSFALAEALRYARAPVKITIDAIPITSFDNRDLAQLRFGDLLFRGGLALTSKAESFGGISALNIEGDGTHFLAITDNGSWLRGRFVYEKGKLVGVTDAEMAPILAADGKPLAAQGRYDVESLTELDGQHYIGIERVEQIVRLDYRRDGLLARGTPIPVPPDFKTFANNKSLECLTGAPKNSPLAGNLIVITEESLDSAGNHRSFLMKPDGSRVERFSVKRSDDYDVTDCTILPPGDLLILERRYSPARGVAMRIRRIPLTAIKPGALVDGRVLIDADMAFQVDNMEGIAVHRTAGGETVITLVSDDNFSVIQRNLLLQFTLVE
jgi:hypothetical protein